MPLSARQIAADLLSAVDAKYNIKDEGKIGQALIALEKNPISKADLEKTRLGKHINILRKNLTDPSLAKRAKQLVRTWNSTYLTPGGRNSSPAVSVNPAVSISPAIHGYVSASNSPALYSNRPSVSPAVHAGNVSFSGALRGNSTASPRLSNAALSRLSPGVRHGLSPASLPAASPASGHGSSRVSSPARSATPASNAHAVSRSPHLSNRAMASGVKGRPPSGPMSRPGTPHLVSPAIGSKGPSSGRNTPKFGGHPVVSPALARVAHTEDYRRGSPQGSPASATGSTKSTHKGKSPSSPALSTGSHRGSVKSLSPSNPPSNKGRDNRLTPSPNFTETVKASVPKKTPPRLIDVLKNPSKCDKPPSHHSGMNGKVKSEAKQKRRRSDDSLTSIESSSKRPRKGGPGVNGGRDSGSTTLATPRPSKVKTTAQIIADLQKSQGLSGMTKPTESETIRQIVKNEIQREADDREESVLPASVLPRSRKKPRGGKTSVGQRLPENSSLSKTKAERLQIYLESAHGDTDSRGSFGDSIDNLHDNHLVHNEGENHDVDVTGIQESPIKNPVPSVSKPAIPKDPYSLLPPIPDASEINWDVTDCGNKALVPEDSGSESDDSADSQTRDDKMLTKLRDKKWHGKNGTYDYQGHWHSWTDTFCIPSPYDSKPVVILPYVDLND